MSFAGRMRWSGGAALALTLLAWISCERPPRQHVLTGEAMGTTYRIKILSASEPAKAKTQIDSILRGLDRALSTWREDSWVARFNASSSTSPAVVPPIVWPLLVEAQALAAETDGRFDITVGRLVKLWGFGPYRAQPRPSPSAAELDAARADCGWTQLHLDDRTRQVAKRRPGLALDFSAIAKGYAVDLITAKLRQVGHEAFLIEFGGEVAARGAPSGQQGWRVKVPGREAPHVLIDAALATSGSDHQHRGNLSHLIDPQSGRPIPIGPPVTVKASTCARADALATAAAILEARKRAQ